MVLGLSIDGEAETNAVVRALELIDELTNELGASLAMAAWEEPPPLDRGGLESGHSDPREPTTGYSPIGAKPNRGSP